MYVVTAEFGNSEQDVVQGGSKSAWPLATPTAPDSTRLLAHRLFALPSPMLVFGSQGLVLKSSMPHLSRRHSGFGAPGSVYWFAARIEAALHWLVRKAPCG